MKKLRIEISLRHVAGALLLLALAPAATSAIAASADKKTSKTQYTIADTKYGPVRGIKADGIERFLGIPFAAPPVGNLRWMPPQAPRPWSLVKDALSYGNTCAQNKRLLNFSDRSASEDCLFMNVFAPQKAKKRPVMVWIYGGGVFAGASNGYDGSALAKANNVVVVSFNYRLTAFGWLAHPALDNGGKNANYGFQDMVFALQWVKQNIDQFGGDPDNVTIFGESAGAFAVWGHIVSPKSKGLFHKAISESGSTVYWQPLLPLATAEETAKKFAIAVGCPDQTAECLRSIPVSKILEVEAQFFVGNDGAIDGYTFLKTMKDSLDSGEFNRVPIINGTNRDEQRWFVALTELLTNHVLKPDEYFTNLQSRFGDDAKSVQKQYPLNKYASPSEAFAAGTGDRSSVCGQRNINLAVSRYVPVYAYEFDDPKAPQFNPQVSFPYGAAHTSEIQYIFPGFKAALKGPAPALDNKQQKLSKQMIDYWSTFAITGNPNSKGEPQWPKFDAKKQSVISLRPNGSVPIQNFSQEHNCQFWDDYNNRRLAQTQATL